MKTPDAVIINTLIGRKIITTKSYFKKNEKEQYYNLFRNYTAQITETPSNPSARKFPSKRTASADSRAICPKICRNRAPNEKLPTQKSSKIAKLHAAYLPAKTWITKKPISQLAIQINWLVSIRNKLRRNPLTSRGVPSSKNPHHKETNQPTCNADQLTGFQKRRAPTKRYFQTDWVPLCGLWMSSPR